MADFVQTLITTIEVGSLYGLIALGYTMVYGILKFINFAHSDIVVLGAWISYTLATARFCRIWGSMRTRNAAAVGWRLVILLGAMAFCGLVGFTIERLAYKPLRRAPRLNVLITAIGVSLLLQNVGQLKYVFGSSPQKMPDLLPHWELAPAYDRQWGCAASSSSIGLVDGIILLTAVVLMLVLEYLVFRTKLGTAMRAVSFDVDAAALMGVPVDRVVSFTFVLGSALAGAAGFFYVLKYPNLKHPGEAVWVLLGSEGVCGGGDRRHRQRARGRAGRIRDRVCRAIRSILHLVELPRRVCVRDVDPDSAGAPDGHFGLAVPGKGVSGGRGRASIS